VKTSGPIGMVHPAVGSPELVPFETLRVSEERFQVRNPKACNYVDGVNKQSESAAVTAALIGLITAGEVLDPLVIWQDSEGIRWVIDGHHRMEALQVAVKSPQRDVWVQRFNGATESDARAFAFEINRRINLNMNAAECLDHYWRTLLCGEAIGSVRGRVKRYGVSQSTVQRMDKEASSVRDALRAGAEAEGVPLNAAYIRKNAPAWKMLAVWRDKVADVGDDPDRRAVEAMLRKLAIQFTAYAQAQPLVLLDAFEEFYRSVTGRAIEIRQLVSEEDSGDF
jgi:hypothetical protein